LRLGAIEWTLRSIGAWYAPDCEGVVRMIETDYLVVGAGASGMAFVDALLARSNARVVMVDRRHRPGGHWLDAYSFVRLHQPSANYGVTSRRLGEDRIDESGLNAGFYERASADEICDYFSRVEADWAGSGRVRFLGMSNYRGQDADGHHVTSLLTGADTLIQARTLVDATYIESEIPSSHMPSYTVDPGVRLIPPNDLVHLNEPAGRFTVIGGGKTAMDTCSWLLDNGVDPDSIGWIKPREAWLFDRASVQPLELVGTFMQMQARWVQAAAEAADGAEFGRRLEAQGVFLRIDQGVEPEMFRGATISAREVDGLSAIERVSRLGRVQHIGRHRIALDHGEVSSGPDDLYIDCTAAGLRPTTPRPVFEPGRITLQLVTIGYLPWSAATIGTVEVCRNDNAEKNLLCPPLTFTGSISDVLDLAHTGMTGLLARSAQPDLADWNDGCRLNPARGAMQRTGDAQVAIALAALGSNIGPAMRNLADRASAPT
jgi:hypothetical protein